MSRPLRFVAASTAILVAAAVLPATAPGQASATSSEGPGPSRPAPQGASGVSVTDYAASSASFSRIPVPSARASARAATWPIGGGRAGISTLPTGVTPSGTPGQQVVSAKMSHFRVYGGVMQGTVNLAGAPTGADPAYLFMRWGFVQDNICSSPVGHGIAFTNTDTDSANNPVYRGARITVKPFRGFAPARSAKWNCAFVDSWSTPDPTAGTLYDSVIGGASLFRQKPLLSIRVKGRQLKRRGFTRIPLIIRNSSATVATAPQVRLRIKTRGVAVRYQRKVGTIRPGAGRKGAFFVRDTRPGRGLVTLIVTSKNYKRTLKVPVTEGRRA